MIVRDTVHGDIYLSENEKRVLDCPVIQRLRGIKQLGTAYLVYPGALHTRFEHSLGTVFMTKKIIATLRRNNYEITSETEELLSIAALMHDVTHVPFGHTIEDERKIFERHDRPERIKHLFSELGGELIDILSELGIKEQIRLILLTKNSDEYSHPWHVQIISGTICADLLDYLRRDSYYVGFCKNYDERIFQYFILEDDHLAFNMVKANMLRLDARSEILHVLRMRYFLTERVYYHHAKIASGAMVAKAVEWAHKLGLQRTDLYRFSDMSLLEHLKTYYGSEKPTILRLIEGVEKRQLLKRAYVLSTKIGQEKRKQLLEEFNQSPSHRQLIEQELIRQLENKGIKAGSEDVIISCPDTGTLKEAEVRVKTPEGLIKLNEYSVPGNPFDWNDVKILTDEYYNLWKFYVFGTPKIVQEAGKICEKIIGKKNEHTV
ncbi:MAG: HD domain-containing protein [Candidatus Hermodarchaeota archaeon]